MQFGAISSHASRVKWARAIIASVEAERDSSPVLQSLTSIAFPTDPTTSSSSSTFTPSEPPTPQAYVWAAARASVGLPERALKGQFTVPPSVSALNVPLSDTLFDAALIPVAAAILEIHVPRFCSSAHAAAYQALIERVASDAPQSLMMAAASTVFQSNGVPASQQQQQYPSAFHAPIGSHRAILDEARAREVSLSAFTRLGVIGQGSYGSVFVWRHKLTSQLYSVKVCEKAVLKSKASVHTAIRELACSVTVSVEFAETRE